MMTKKERAAFDAMAAELAQLRALHIEMGAPDKDVPVPKGGTIAIGWDFNIHRVSSGFGFREAVYPVSSSAVSHIDGKHEPVRDYVRGSSWSQNGVASYSTRRRALQALRAKVCRQHAEALARIDAEIEKEPE